MATLTYVKVAGAIDNLMEGNNAGTDQWAFALASAAPGSPTFVAGTTDLATAGGYTAGGNNVATTSSAESAGTYKLVVATPATWTASGGGFTYRYYLLVDKTTNIVPGYWDRGSSAVVASGDTVTFTPSAPNGVIQVT